MSDTLLIYDAGTSGTVVAVAACNEKSRTKSLEQGELWIVDPATGRVLPFSNGGVGYDGFRERDSWWEAHLTGPGGSASPEGTVDASASSPAASSAGSQRSGSMNAEADPATGPGGSASRADTVLGALGEIIAERHRAMPEGSYTTHLFSKGAEKIRKKVGEEAVELILAGDPEQIRSEGADLIYHMMVLLESEGLRMEEVLSELDRRHRNG